VEQLFIKNVFCVLTDNRTCASTITQLTFGDWEVLEQSESVCVCDQLTYASSPCNPQSYRWQVWVDELSQMVYFMALKDSPLESHLWVGVGGVNAFISVQLNQLLFLFRYSVSYTDPGNPVRLTSLGASHAVAMSKVPCCNLRLLAIIVLLQ